MELVFGVQVGGRFFHLCALSACLEILLLQQPLYFRRSYVEASLSQIIHEVLVLKQRNGEGL
jgi:hypothetical protein